MRLHLMGLIAGTILLAGCSGSSSPATGGGVAPPDGEAAVVRNGVSEKDLVEEPGLEADLSDTVLVLLEEAGETESQDTGGSGDDEVPWSLPAGEMTLELGADAFADVASAVLFDAQGVEVLRASPDAPSATADLAEGDYRLELTASAEVGEAPAPILVGVPPTEEAAPRDGAEQETPELRRLRVRKDAGKGTDMRGLDIAGQEVKFARWQGANLTGADLTGTTLTLGRLDNAILSRASLIEGQFDLTNFDAVVMDKCNAYRAQFSACVLADAILDRSTLIEARIHDRMAGASFVGVVAMGARFSGRSAERTDFTGARLNGASFGSLDLREAIFRDADLTGVDFGNADLTGAIFSDGRVCKPGPPGRCN